MRRGRASEMSLPFGEKGPFMKACGMTREADIEAVNEAAPLFCGFVIDFPKSHRSIPMERAEELAAGLHDGIVPVGVFVDAPVGTVAGMVGRGVISTVQLHGSEDDAYISELREKASPKAVIKAFKVRTAQDVERACESIADMILLDNGQGSGESFDWSLCRTATRPFMLAGGLGPGNVASAIGQAHPWAVDMSSGIETGGFKDKGKIIRAARNVKELRR